ncbi:hypothetical protein AJ80_01144 [Polytolypa hystricis UAMH7299]|uniref:Uncharacterized protein n=1 Tax=Polytolypa hystricis (strain UAMH7299) TaxID=1447883 RepID=A0A2B7Z2Y0_POLH7|nr:hypothetical protein AJ80_01144 [Polytolypa hystricis UAMH7299]
MASLLPTVNLPLPILLHALGLAGLGIYGTFKGRPAMTGIAATGLGLAYLFTSYMPVEQNQFLHASVPVRLILAALAALKLPTAWASDRNPLLVVALYDGLGALWLGYSLGIYNGRIAGY